MIKIRQIVLKEKLIGVTSENRDVQKWEAIIEQMEADGYTLDSTVATTIRGGYILGGNATLVHMIFRK